jgi:tRNA pseudouridine55 synthase
MVQSRSPTMPAPSRPGATPAGFTGMAVVDKEPGWTSHDVVARCRGVFGQRRVGHAGTLDPDATGLLLVGLGRFTRMLRFLGDLRKTYEAEVVLGIATTTLDASGEVTQSWDMAGVTLDDVRLAATSLTGAIEQIPPMVSAVKVDGRRLYELARAGIEVERKPRPVVVDRFDVSAPPAGSEPGIFRIEVDCSSGTYIRTLGADLGAALGGGAHVRSLRRTAIGSFSVDHAQRIDELSAENVLTPAQALRDMTQVEVDAEMSKLVTHGLPLDRISLGAPGEGPWALVDGAGELLAVYERTATDRVVAACVLVSSG